MVRKKKGGDFMHHHRPETTIGRRTGKWLLTGILLLGIGAGARLTAQDAPAAGSDKEEIAKLKSELAALKATTEKLEDRVDAMAAKPEPSTSGTTKFLITGYAAGGFNSQTGSPGGFYGQFSPIFLWKLSDRILATAEINLKNKGGASEVELEYANLSIILNRYMTVTAGKFLTPFSSMMERYHPAWINKSVDNPIHAQDEFMQFPESTLGVQVRGGAPMGNARLRYAAWVGNGPMLNTDPGNAGTLDWMYESASRYNSDSRSYGAHLWVLPIPELEFGAAAAGGRADGAMVGQKHVKFNQYEFDASLHFDKEALKGTLDFRGEYVRTKLENLDYMFGDPVFNNSRDGGYGQVSYRPDKVDMFIRNLEPVIRYDWNSMPQGDPNRFDQRRWTAGLNYYFSASTLLKLGYRFDTIYDPAGIRRGEDAFNAVFAVGF